MARIIDIKDEKNPKVVSKLMHEIHLASNCDKTLPDLVGLSSFTYGTHYCSVDNRQNATTLACGQFNSGIRVYDIRDPLRPKEIAYYNPAGYDDGGSGLEPQPRRRLGGRRPRLVLCAGPPRCEGGHAVDHLPGQRCGDAQVPQGRLAVPTEFNAGRTGELTARPVSRYAAGRPGIWINMPADRP